MTFRLRLLSCLAGLLLVGGGLAFADSVFSITVTARSRLVTVAWTPPTNAQGYLFSVDGKKVSSTLNAAQAKATFARQSGSHSYTVQYLTVGGSAEAVYPIAVTTTTTTTSQSTTTNPQTFDWHAAYQAGGTYVLPCGTYPAANIQGTGKPVTFQAATTGCVTLPGLSVTNGASAVTFNGVNAASFYINGSTNISLTYSNFGPCSQTPTSTCGPNDIDSNPAGNNIVLDHDSIHDYSTPPQYESQFHQQCLTIAGETNVTVSNTTFTGCQVFDIFLQYGSSVAAGNFDGLKLTGNTFAAPLQGNGDIRDTAVEFSPRGYQFRNVLVSGNVFAAGSTLTWDSETPFPTAFTVSGNSFGVVSPCWAGVTYSGNTVAGKPIC